MKYVVLIKYLMVGNTSTDGVCDSVHSVSALVPSQSVFCSMWVARYPQHTLSLGDVVCM